MVYFILYGERLLEALASSYVSLLYQESNGLGKNRSLPLSSDLTRPIGLIAFLALKTDTRRMPVPSVVSSLHKCAKLESLYHISCWAKCPFLVPNLNRKEPSSALPCCSLIQRKYLKPEG